MVNVLCIGKYNEIGNFTGVRWDFFLEWCKIECNKVIIYSKMSYDRICNKFSKTCSIKSLDKPDKALDVNSYEISVIHSSFWEYIKKYNYDIDSCNDISHIYFFRNEFYIASLEIVDYENYVLFEEISNQQSIFLEKEIQLENAVLCFKGKDDINELLEETWKPFGESGGFEDRKE